MSLSFLGILFFLSLICVEEEEACWDVNPTLTTFTFLNWLHWEDLGEEEGIVSSNEDRRSEGVEGFADEDRGVEVVVLGGLNKDRGTWNSGENSVLLPVS